MRYGTMALVLLMASCHMTAVADQSKPSTSQITSDQQAGSLLLEAYYLREQGKPWDALRIFEKVAASNPRLLVDSPDGKVHLMAIAELAHTYAEVGEYDKALSKYAETEQYAWEMRPDQPTVIPMAMVRCRKQMAKLGKLPADPLVFVNGRPWQGSGIVADDVTLLPASQLGKKLGLNVVQNDQSTVIISSTKDKQRALTMKVGSKTATANDGKSLGLATAPRNDNTEVLVPLRTVAEYFGWAVDWDSVPAVAWVSSAAAE